MRGGREIGGRGIAEGRGIEGAGGEIGEIVQEGRKGWIMWTMRRQNRMRGGRGIGRRGIAVGRGIEE